MGNQDIYEVWNKETAGVLSVTPLILKACEAGMIGQAVSFPGGCIYKSMFTYLCGIPDSSFLSEHPDILYESRLVCMSDEWAEYIRKLPAKFILRRELMEPFCSESSKIMNELPEGYSLSPFTEEIFDMHPFDHGSSYSDYQDFVKNGAGAAVMYNGQVVSAASSFLTLEDHVELDVFTEPEHRHKGLADHCVYEMLKQCWSKGLTVHWDAQNRMSSKMAVSHGFVPVTDYAVYWLEG